MVTRIALAQLEATSDKSVNLSKIERLVAEAAGRGSDLVSFPEASIGVAVDESSLVGIAEPLEGRFVGELRELARRNRIAVAVGTFESAPGADRVYNTVVVIGPSGDLLGSYRKIHLYDAFGFRES